MVSRKDAGDLKRSELNELVENLTCLNALEGKFWKSDQKIVMDGKFVKNFVMDAKIDPKVVMDLSIFKIGGWNSLQPIKQKLLKQRSIPCDTVLGKTLCEFRSAHEEIDVPS